MLPCHVVGTCGCEMGLGCQFLAAASLEIVSTKIIIQVEKRSRTVIKMALFLNLVYHYPFCLETRAIHHWWLEAFSLHTAVFTVPTSTESIFSQTFFFFFLD